MTLDYDTKLRRLARTLAEIAHALESSDHPAERVERALTLTRLLVPYQQCGVLRAATEDGPQLYAVPPQTAEAWERLLGELTAALELLVRGEGPARRAADARPQLTVPLVGLDQVVGLLRVEQGEQSGPYDAEHIRLLSVVAAQLGAYLTMLRLRQEDVRRAQELAEAHAFQQKLVGMVSHDLRSPLTVISVVASTLLKKVEDPERAKAIERALRNARRASRLVSDLLDVTHIRVAGGMAIAPTRLDVAELVHEVVEDMRTVHPGREISFAAEVGRRGAQAELDAERVMQVITNLLNNALQYGEAQSPVRVSVEAPDEGEELVVTVGNRGRPIPAARLASIFDPFRQGSEVRRPVGGGLGLGLYIVDQVVRAHGGRTAVHSNAESGTTFTVTVPRVAPRRLRAAETRGGVVLVVDDDFGIRDGVAELLEANGYVPVTASHGQEALELIHKGLRPSLIVLDVHMPVMDGEAFAAAVRAEPDMASTPLLIVSADASQAIRLAREQRADFMEKPVQPAALLHVIKPLAG